MLKRKKVLIAFGILGIVIYAILWGFLHRERPNQLRVGLFLFAQNTVISEINNGFRRELDQIASNRNITLDYVERNADGNAAQVNVVAGFFKNSQVDAVFVVGLPAAQALKATGLKTPVVFGGPPDPVVAGLVPRLTCHGSNFTGTRYLPPSDIILNVFRDVYPAAESVAVLHNPGEANSMSVVRDFLAAAGKRKLKVIDYGASSVTELEAALQTLARDKPSALFIPTDNLMHASLERILASASQVGIPVFDCTKSAVQKGAVFSVGTDYAQIGALSARVASRILFDGIKPGDIDVMDVTEGFIYIKEGVSLGEKFIMPNGYEVIRIP